MFLQDRINQTANKTVKNSSLGPHFDVIHQSRHNAREAPGKKTIPINHMRPETSWQRHYLVSKISESVGVKVKSKHHCKLSDFQHPPMGV